VSDRLFDQRPAQEVLSQSGRSIEIDYLVGESPGREGTKQHFVTLTVSYNSGGINYWNYETDPRCYQASIAYEVQERGKVFTSRSFTVGQGLRILRSDPVKRFSRKQLQAFVPVAQERLQEIQESDQVQAIIRQARDGCAIAQEQAA
jgi:hypothetical protein